MNERDQAMKRLQESVDHLVEKTDLQLKMQVKPIKMLGSSAGGGFIFGFLLGRRGRKIKKVYIERDNPKEFQKKQKIKINNQAISPWGGLRGAFIGMIITALFKVIQEVFLAPILANYADQLTEKGQKIDKKTVVLSPKDK